MAQPLGLALVHRQVREADEAVLRRHAPGGALGELRMDDERLALHARQLVLAAGVDDLDHVLESVPEAIVGMRVQRHLAARVEQRAGHGAGIDLPAADDGLQVDVVDAGQVSDCSL